MKTFGLTLILTLIAGGLFAGIMGNAWEGTWKLNESKSKITRGTTKNQTVVYDMKRLGRNKVKVTTDGVDGSGKPTHTEWTGMFDGKDYALSGDPGADTRAYTKVNDTTLSIVSKKGGKQVGTARVAVSEDGKSRTVTVHGTTDKGKKFTNTAVYDKG